MNYTKITVEFFRFLKIPIILIVIYLILAKGFGIERDFYKVLYNKNVEVSIADILNVKLSSQNTLDEFTSITNEIMKACPNKDKELIKKLDDIENNLVDNIIRTTKIINNYSNNKSSLIYNDINKGYIKIYNIKQLNELFNLNLSNDLTLGEIRSNLLHKEFLITYDLPVIQKNELAASVPSRYNISNIFLRNDKVKILSVEKLAMYFFLKVELKKDIRVLKSGESFDVKAIN